MGPDKAKPFERGGRKAAGLKTKTAELPKDDAFGMLGYLLFNRDRENRGGEKEVNQNSSLHEWDGKNP